MATVLEPSPRLFTMFFDCYQIFKTRFKEAECTNAIICFGTSGAGKSTFLARLRSREAARAFYDALPKAEGEKRVLEDIQVGSGVGSTTLVPVMYPVGDLRVFDVPGFKDTDHDKQIVINILHKCLLTKVKEAKFLVIVNVNDIMSPDQEKFDRVIDDYHNKLKEVFGEANYASFIDTLHFVLTKNDNEKYTEAQIRTRLDEVTLQVVRKIRNKGLTEFLGRMVENHITVDYTRDTQERLLTQLNAFVSAPTAIGVRIPDIDRESLDLHANALNGFCARTIDAKIDTVVQFGSRVNVDFIPTKDKVLSLRDEVHAVQTTVAKQESEVVQLKRVIDESIRSIVENDKLMKRMIVAIEQSENEISRLKTDQEFMANTLDKFQSVSLRGDVARDTGVLGKYFEFRSHIVMAPQEHEHMTCLVVGDEPGDETLRGYIENGGALVPKDITKVSQCKIDIVKFNNSMNHVDPAFFKVAPVVQYSPSEGLLKVTFASFRKFRVLIYTSVPFARTAAAEVQKDFYRQGLNRACAELETLTSQHQQAEADIEQARTTEHVSKAQLGELELELKNTLRTEQTKLSDFALAIEAAKGFVKEHEAKVKAHAIARDGEHRGDHDKDATLIKEVSKIFAENNLKSELIGKIQAHEAEVAAIRTTLSDMMTQIKILERLKEVKMAADSPLSPDRAASMSPGNAASRRSPASSQKSPASSTSPWAGAVSAASAPASEDDFEKVPRSFVSYRMSGGPSSSGKRFG
mmetsp:Transcript_7189/g.18447  ORF Transcript_7189/g.18447 Transcript_7189/m.18447 type:complete len:748 (+) Transcript_7189:311-2554(+)|eukprot:CAMPEP_0182943212 /NCGR_PEP_ID=MMETSP0105_2-20130417/51994_1 /TAXON_ID=81532 ORGANISM="Acanthoeca-like sp., Strain 10tr" /NCGR_SAMPLE_ID=MMETSP0105_2 /ASSEMBLY_ACC=CAM_ASM_000205 /LENGTH=747 /DNA_ID=CAMNT_0025083037 /DNA_START=272 /DNA_END=2515 /DNA_ORIENTATION=+